jgi:hypothetical protein
MKFCQTVQCTNRSFICIVYTHAMLCEADGPSISIIKPSSKYEVDNYASFSLHIGQSYNFTYSTYIYVRTAAIM